MFNKKKDITPESLARIRKMQICADLVLILIIGAIGIYVFSEIESVKLLLNDPCQVCMNKTGAMCYKLMFP